MADLIIGENIGEVWADLVQLLIAEGKEVSPRGYKTLEIRNVTIEVLNGLQNVLCSEVRDLNYRFMIAEFLWIAAGLEDVETLAHYNSVMRNFSDDGEILNGAYGPRLSYQWEYIFENIQKAGSRQAVSVIWTPNPEDSRDIPCTLSLQWMIRDGYLHCTVTMRSSDVWLGLPYDYFTFSQLTNLVSSWLNVPVGSITMNLASSHLYLSNYEQALKIDQAFFIESPQISLGSFPNRETIKMILDPEIRAAHEVDDLPFLFMKYEEALLFDKAHALEVLIAVSPK